MAKPVESDFINAHLITKRILLRKMFERLRDRPQSKYFKNVIIKDVAWRQKTFVNHTPPINLPPKFLEKYPFDFEISFTPLGCNVLKCYAHKPKKSQPVLINDYIVGGGEACLGIYREFNDYLREKFFLAYVKDNNSNDEDDYLPFETLAIHDKFNNENYCGLQLTPLKTFSLSPSSRWNGHDDTMTVREYIERYKGTTPLRLREVAGLVDAPPLTWDKKKQNARFNSSYCTRFNKLYDETEDVCYYHFMRKGINYILGENFVNNASPSLENIITNRALPFQHINSLVMGEGLNVDEGYSEKNISQAELEKLTHVDQPDLIGQKPIKVVDRSAAYAQKERRKIADRVGALFSEIISQMATDYSIEMSLTALPNLGARIVKHYSSKFLYRALLIQHSSTLPVSVRLFSLTARVVINEMTLKMAIRMLSFISSAANILFTVTLVTMIPEFIFTYYNVGGFNNEISRESLNERRQHYLENLLKTTVEQCGDQLTRYVVVDDGEYVSPVLTPEFIYYLCLMNFLKHNPDKNTDISHTGIATDDEYEEIALDYIKCLEVNAVGQKIIYDHNEEENVINSDVIKTDYKDKCVKNNNNIITTITNSNNNFLTDCVLRYHIDIYFLILATLLLLIVSFVLLLNSFSQSACILLYTSLSLYLIWFFIFLPLFTS